MVELRKRKAPAGAPAPPAKKANSLKGAASKAKAAITSKKETTANGSATPSAVSVGSTITLEDFGGEIETNDGKKTTLKQLVDESTGGVVLFTYPKASTPGCTTQACLFRDEFTPLTVTGLSIYGLSRDSPKANTTFKTKQNLPYALLCDPSATLIGAIGFKKATGTTRGVFVVDKSGKVLAAEAGGPAATVQVVKKLVAGTGSAAPMAESTEPAAPANAEVEKDDAAKAAVAADVADTAQKLDAPAPVPA